MIHIPLNIVINWKVFFYLIISHSSRGGYSTVYREDDGSWMIRKWPNTIEPDSRTSSMCYCTYSDVQYSGYYVYTDSDRL